MKLTAQIISILFHPLLMIIYLLFILLAINPYMFALQDPYDKTLFFVYTFVSALIIPVMAIFIMKMLGFVHSIEMKNKSERIGPMIVIGSLYLWLYINFKNNPSVPDLFVSFMLGSVIAVFVSFFINNFTKISLHMVGVGGMILALLLIKTNMPYDQMLLSIPDTISITISSNLLIVIGLLIAGLTGTARLYLKAHVPQDIYGGLFVGILSQLIAYVIIF